MKLNSIAEGARDYDVVGHACLSPQVLGNIHSVLFGLDLIGNPSKLISNIETGIKELIDETEQGFERHTRGSGVTGVAVGVKDLLGQVIGKTS